MKRPRQAHTRHGGFTLLELLVVLVIMALATAGVGLALRESDADLLDREALRLSALLEAARAESRASGTALLWRPRPEGFEFPGAAPAPPQPAQTHDNGSDTTTPRAWLAPGVNAQVLQPAATPWLVLGPEPVLPAQALALSLGQRRLVIASDGLRPFAVQADGPWAQGGLP